jgi:hypothetical protein
MCQKFTLTLISWFNTSLSLKSNNSCPSSRTLGSTVLLHGHFGTAVVQILPKKVRILTIIMNQIRYVQF